MAASSRSVLTKVVTTYPSSCWSAVSIFRSSADAAVARASKITLPLAMNVSTPVNPIDSNTFAKTLHLDDTRADIDRTQEGNESRHGSPVSG